jgi:replicative DNA helicase
MDMTTERLILRNLIHNDEFLRKAIPFIKEEYFSDKIERRMFKEIDNFVQRYNSPPSADALKICINDIQDFNEKEYTEAKNIVENISLEYEKVDEKWLMDTAEKFCKDRSIYNAILESIQIIDGNSEQSKNHLPSLLQDALSVSFDVNIGHDYVEDAEERYDFYHKKEDKIPFDLDFFNKITNNGTPQKTLNVILAGTGVGKSLFMCHHAANCLTQNKNVLYITCEMAEERIAERIDANLMDMTMDDLRNLPKKMYEKKISETTKNINGKLIIKEYPTATANVNHFRALLEELEMKKKFVPDIIFIDYLNICAAARFKNGANVNSYMYIKAIAEELRGLAVEMNLPIFTATQTNRSGFANTDVGLEDTSESFGLPATADFMFAVIATEELDELNQVLVKQLKNRYNDPSSNRKFIIGINRAKMKLYDVSSVEQEDLVCSGQSTYSRDSLDEKFKTKSATKVSEEPFSDWNI